MTHIFRGRYGDGKFDAERCREAVHETSGWGFYQCNRKAVVFRCVEGAEYGFCRQHDPEAVAERRAKREAEWTAKWAARDAADARRQQERAAGDAAKAALKQIAAGHNDPRTLAAEVLAMFPATDADLGEGGEGV